MTDNFDRAFAMLCQFEGYISDLKGDPGGYTIWGITERWYPDDVKKMASMSPAESKEYAKGFYKRNFWDVLGCDSLPLPLDIIAFDTSVNCGIKTAKKLLNETRDWKDYLYKRLFYYTLLVKEKPQMKDFLRGWLNRCLSLWTAFKGV
jgi:lysozyme family protein